MRMPGISSGIRKGLLIGMVAAAMLGPAALAAEPAAADPAALASTYEKQAADLRALADRHDHMGKMHKGGAGSSKMNHDNVVRHCDKIAQDLRAAAKESDALATTLRDSAKK